MSDEKIAGPSVEVGLDVSKVKTGADQGVLSFEKLGDAAVTLDARITPNERSIARLADRLRAMSPEAATQKLNVLAAAIEKAGGVSERSGAQLDFVRSRIERLAAAGGSVPASLEAIRVKGEGLRLSMGALGGELGRLAIGYLGFREITGVVRDSLAALGQKQDALNQLTLALANQGHLTDSASKGLRAYADELSRTTTFSVNATLATEAYFANLGMTEAQIKKATGAAADLASVTGLDLKDAALQLGRAIETGTSRTLRNFGITIDKAADSSGRLDDIVRQISEHFPGAAAAAASTYTGRLKQVQNAAEEARASFGFFLQQLAAPPGAGTVGFLQSLSDFIARDMVLGLADLRAELTLRVPAAVAEMVAKAEKILADHPNFLKGLTFGQVSAGSLAKSAQEASDLAKALRFQAGQLVAEAQHAVDTGIGPTIAPKNNPNPRGLADPTAHVAENETQKLAIQLEKEYADAVAGESIGLDAAIEKVHAHAAAKREEIEANQKLNASQKAYLEGLVLINESAQISLARTEALRKTSADAAAQRTEAHKLEAETLHANMSALDIELEKIEAERVARLDAARAVLAKAQAEGRDNDELRTSVNEHVRAANAMAEGAVQAAVLKDSLDQLASSHEQLDRDAHAFFESYFKQLERIPEATQQIGEAISGVGRLIGGLGLKPLADIASGGAGLFEASARFQKMQIDALKEGRSLTGLQSFVGKLGVAEAVVGLGASLLPALKKLFGGKSEQEEIGEEIGRTIGAKLSDSTLKAVEETEKGLNVGRRVAEAMHVSDMIRDNPDLDPSKFSSLIGDLANAVKLGIVPAKEGIAELGRSFTALKTAAENGSVASETAMVAVIHRAKELGLVVPEIQDAVKGLVADATKELKDFFAGQGSGVAGGRNQTGELTGAVSPEQAAANETIFGAVFDANVALNGVVQAAMDTKDGLDALSKTLPEGMALTGSAGQAALVDKALDNPLFKGAATSSKAGATILGSLEKSDDLSQGVVDAFGTTLKSNMAQAIAGTADLHVSPDEQRKLAEEANLPLLAQLQHAEAEGAHLSDETKAELEQARTDGILPLKSIAEQSLDMERQIRDAVLRGANLAVPDSTDTTTPTGAPSTTLPPGSPTDWLGTPPTNVANLPQFDTGIARVPYDMVAVIHQGEAVIPAAENRRGGDVHITPTFNLGGITVQAAPGQDPRAIGESVAVALERQLSPRLQTLLREAAREALR